MLRVKEAIVVEGRYDKNSLLQVVDALVIETGGFQIYNDRQKRKLLRRLAETRGLILLTDSDGAGFQIRGFLKGCVEPKYIKQAYVPDIYGKERRKAAPSKEGKLGVEGMSPQVLLQALERAGATFLDREAPERREEITMADMFAMGLAGGQGSAQRRQELLKKLDLPQRMNASALLEVLNALMTREEFLSLE